MPTIFDPADFEPIRRIALSFPGAEDSVSHENTPSIKVRGKLMCRLHDSGTFVPIRLDVALRDTYLDSHPETFHLPEHFRAYPYICLWLPVSDMALLREVLEASWRGLASKKQLAEYFSE